jgi:hypothetical protein
VLASVTNQELVSYAWIFPNVVTNGHWWYSNTPSFIARDATARLEAVPQTKQIAYYSDAYKLEFVWPKFDMYRRILSGVLTDHFVKENGWSEERAIELGRQVLRDNVDEVFPRPSLPLDGDTGQDNFDTENITVLNDDSNNTEEELDPLPSHDEIQSADADDIQLLDDSIEQIRSDSDEIASNIDPEPLDVGDILSEDTDESPGPQIRMLRSDDSFELGEESLRVHPDPVTGELKFPVNKDSEEESEPGET